VVRADGRDHVPPVARQERGRRPSGRAAAGSRSPARHRLCRRRARRGRRARAARRARLRRLPEDLRLGGHACVLRYATVASCAMRRTSARQAGHAHRCWRVLA
jgi:hypothetical protein